MGTLGAIQRKFRSQTFDLWTDAAKSCRKSQRRGARSKKIKVHGKVEKLRNPGFFQCSGGSKSSIAKAAGGEPPGWMRDQKLHAMLKAGRCLAYNSKLRALVTPKCEVLLKLKKFMVIFTEKRRRKLTHSVAHSLCARASKRYSTHPSPTRAQGQDKISFRSISEFALPSMHHNNSPVL